MTGYKKTKLLAATVRSGRMSKRTLFGQLGLLCLLCLYCTVVVGVVNCGVLVCQAVMLHVLIVYACRISCASMRQH